METYKKHQIPTAIALILIASFSLLSAVRILAQTNDTSTIAPRQSNTISGTTEPQQSVSAPTCTYTYSDWSECTANGTQTRLITSKKPEGCTGNPEKTSQSCTYKTPTCAYTYSDWSACATNNTQTRTVRSQAPSGCSGNPETQKSCTYIAPASTTSATSDNASASSDNNTTSSTSNTSSDNTTTSSSSSTTDTTPKFIFTNVSAEQKISGIFAIRGKVADANNVEYYLIPAGSNTYKYIGTANYENSEWLYEFDSAKFPNGSFSLSAKIKNAYGSYDGPKIRIGIDNGLTQAQTTPATTDKTASQTDSTEQPIQNLDNSQPENFNGETSREWQNKFFGAALCLKADFCGANADPDKDGLMNKDEMRFNTDPKKPDTDGDGFLDGDEIKNGFDPNKYAPGDKTDRVVFESPKETGEIKKDTYSVTSVAVVKNENQTNGLKLEGKGLPNSFINIYIYSNTPIILTVKTDADGNWSYTLDKDLENGNHEVFVAVTDNTGKIQAKSEPIAFVKTAEAVSIIPPVEASNDKSISPIEKRRNTDLLMISIIVTLTFAVALAMIGLRIIHKHNLSKNLNENSDEGNL